MVNNEFDYHHRHSVVTVEVASTFSSSPSPLRGDDGGSVFLGLKTLLNGKLTATCELAGYVNGSSQTDRSFVKLIRVFICY